MNILIIVVTIVLLGFIVLVNKAASKSIEAMSHPEDMLEVLDNIDDQQFIEVFSQFESWITSKGYVHECYFLSKTINANEVIQCSAWWSEEVKSWALIYFAQEKQTIDFVTIYSDNVGVTTSSNKDSILLPSPPKSYKQVFTGLTNDQLYEKHLQARNFVEYTEKVSPLINKPNLLSEVKKSLMLQSKFIMGLPMWRFKGIYWYFVRRNLKANKPISSSGIPSDFARLSLYLKEKGIVGHVDISPPLNEDIEYTAHISLDSEGSKILSFTKCHNLKGVERNYQDSLKNLMMSGQAKNGLYLMTLTFASEDKPLEEKIKTIFEEYSDG